MDAPVVPKEVQKKLKTTISLPFCYVKRRIGSSGPKSLKTTLRRIHKHLINF